MTRFLPILPLRDIVVFPHRIVPLFVGRERSVRALEDGRTKWLVWAGVCVGLGFETKMGAALLVVPALILEDRADSLWLRQAAHAINWIVWIAGPLLGYEVLAGTVGAFDFSNKGFELVNVQVGAD